MYAVQNVEAGIGKVDGGNGFSVVDRAWSSALRRQADTSIAT